MMMLAHAASGQFVAVPHYSHSAVHTILTDFHEKITSVNDCECMTCTLIYSIYPTDEETMVGLKNDGAKHADHSKS